MLTLTHLKTNFINESRYTNRHIILNAIINTLIQATAKQNDLKYKCPWVTHIEIVQAINLISDKFLLNLIPNSSSY